MSFIDWLLGGRSKRPEPPAVQQLWATDTLLGVLYATGQARSWRLDGEAVHDERVAGPRVQPLGERLIDSQHEDFFGLPFLLDAGLLRVGKGELRQGDTVVEAAWLQPSAQMRIEVAQDGRVALLDPFLNQAGVWDGTTLQRFGQRDLPVMDGAFVGDELHLVREGHIERYDRTGRLLERLQPHGLQTLAVAPGVSLGLDARDQLELSVDSQTLGPAPERAYLNSSHGVVVATRAGFYVDGQFVTVPHQGVLSTPHGVFVASEKPALYDRGGRCIRVFG